MPFLATALSPLLLIGLVCLVYGGTLAIQYRGFLRRAASAKGTVIGMEKYTKRNYPIVRYEARSGQGAQFKSRVSSYSYEIGQEVGVLYDPDDLRTAEIDSDDAWYSALAMPVGGALICAFYLACLLGAYLLGPRGASQAA